MNLTTADLLTSSPINPIVIEPEGGNGDVENVAASKSIIEHEPVLHPGQHRCAQMIACPGETSYLDHNVVPLASSAVVDDGFACSWRGSGRHDKVLAVPGRNRGS